MEPGTTTTPHYKVAFETFGCRLNQAETAIFTRQFSERGYQRVEDVTDADLCIINTCTLTAQATSKCRRLIRSIIRSNPDVCIAAVGCYAQTGAEELQTIDGLDYIIGTSEKMRIPDIIPSPVKLPEPVVVRDKAARASFTIDSVGLYPMHTRANLKVQEGCNFVCSFCIIPRSRGPARSREFGDILREATMLAAEGHRELVITGVNIGTYDDGGHTMADVVDKVAAIDGVERVRLSSIEPTTIESNLIDRMTSGDTLCPYLHVPLQSGDEGIIEKMRRRYGVREYVDFMEDAVRRVPNIGLGTDVIVGFPGETDDAFDNTCQVIESLPFNNVHVFSFSAREGTGAWNMADQVPGDVIKQRSRILHDIGARKKREFYETQVGRTLRVLFEERHSTGMFVGFSDNYVKVAVESADDIANHIGEVEITHVADSGRAGLLACGRVVNCE